ncbi:hypothetical protein IFU39_16345 [Paenibacillus sp. CFBP 13594]|uniref:hypothetical protein n=1 Tax=Paenibacillus sp. CFBP 13594 TaxID=2774037 RepID=UPI0017867CD0|nr:hypothetical protein [Paenibacillus sp. CFBP 13594]MBD8839383.1 hypothetical protein [Paenibacillus sp. CFBP 13594]
MDKSYVLSELLFVVHNMKGSIDENEFNSLTVDSLWNVIKEICGIKADGKFSDHLLKYVLDMLDDPKRKGSDDEPYKKIIDYLTNSKIETHENF